MKINIGHGILVIILIVLSVMLYRSNKKLKECDQVTANAAA